MRGHERRRGADCCFGTEVQLELRRGTRGGDKGETTEARSLIIKECVRSVTCRVEEKE